MIQLSKEVRALREYEATLLSSYQKYLQYLETVIKSKSLWHCVVVDSFYLSSENWNNLFIIFCEMVDSLSQHTNESSLSLATLALKCLIQLLCDLPHFNFRSNIIQTLVPLMNSQNDSVRDANSKKISYTLC
jgi:hypothetical protein